MSIKSYAERVSDFIEVAWKTAEPVSFFSAPCNIMGVLNKKKTSTIFPELLDLEYMYAENLAQRLSISKEIEKSLELKLKTEENKCFFLNLLSDKITNLVIVQLENAFLPRDEVIAELKTLTKVILVKDETVKNVGNLFLKSLVRFFTLMSCALGEDCGNQVRFRENRVWIKTFDGRCLPLFFDNHKVFEDFFEAIEFLQTQLIVLWKHFKLLPHKKFVKLERFNEFSVLIDIIQDQPINIKNV